jgi:hypothetical protein
MKLTRGSRRIKPTRQNQMAAIPFQSPLHAPSKPASIVTPIFRSQPFGAPGGVFRSFCRLTGETPGYGTRNAATGGSMTGLDCLHVMEKQSSPNPCGVSHA